MVRLVMVIFLGAACGVAPDGQTGGAPGDDACVGPTCACERETLKLEPGLAPNVLLVVDRSSSMNNVFDDSYVRRWEATVLALSNLVTNLDHAARFALSYFPTDNQCATDGPDVPFAPNGGSNAAAIRASLADTTATGFTPTYGALYQAQQALAMLTDPNPELIVLATDGVPNCGCLGQVNGFEVGYCAQEPVCTAPCRLAENTPDPGDAAEMITTLKEKGISTYVIGIAFPQSEETLTDFARRGGTTSYYPAQNSLELEQALATIGQRAVRCTLELTSPPHDPNKTEIVIDGTPLPRSTTNGWEFIGDKRGVVISGTFCDQLQTGTHEVIAIYECPVLL